MQTRVTSLGAFRVEEASLSQHLQGCEQVVDQYMIYHAPQFSLTSFQDYFHLAYTVVIMARDDLQPPFPSMILAFIVIAVVCATHRVHLCRFAVRQAEDSLNEMFRSSYKELVQTIFLLASSTLIPLFKF